MSDAQIVPVSQVPDVLNGDTGEFHLVETAILELEFRDSWIEFENVIHRNANARSLEVLMERDFRRGGYIIRWKPNPISPGLFIVVH